MAEPSNLLENSITSLLHPSDYLELRDNQPIYQTINLTEREETFRSRVRGTLERGNYSRVSRAVGLFVAVYHYMNEDELQQIHRAKEVLEDELTDVTTGLVHASTFLELNKMKLRRPIFDESYRQQLQARVFAAQTTLDYDMKLMGRLLEDIGLLAAIEEEET